MRKKLLALNTSLQEGFSVKMVSHFRALWQEQGGEIIERDLAKETVPHLDFSVIKAIKQAQCEDEIQEKALALSERLITEIREVDAIVIGMPLYNLAAPSVFQSYLDYVVRAGVTFQYTKQGPVGLLDNKPVYILCSRGGVFSGDNAHMDTQTLWLKNILGFIGLSSLQFIYAEGLGLSEGVAIESLKNAKQQITNLFENTIAQGRCSLLPTG